MSPTFKQLTKNPQEGNRISINADGANHLNSRPCLGKQHNFNAKDEFSFNRRNNRKKGSGKIVYLKHEGLDGAIGFPTDEDFFLEIISSRKERK